MTTTIKDMETSIINVPKILEDTASRVEIFIWENKYKEAQRKYTNFDKNNKKTYSLLLQHCTTKLEENLKRIDTYD